MEIKIQSIYGSSLCPNCGRKIYGALGLVENVIPPPVIKVGCGCTAPPQEIELYYSAHMVETMRKELGAN